MASPLLPSSTKASLFEPSKVDITVTSQTPDPDRTIRVAHAFLYFKQAWYVIACFIALISLCHFFSRFYISYSCKRNLGRPPVVRGKISLRRLPGATLHVLRVISFRSTISIGQSYILNLAQVFVTAAYITTLFTWALVNSTSTKGVKYDPHYWANIAGTIVATQLPLVAALGMKNNIISYLTGISAEKLNFLHRVTARVICTLIWLHASGRIRLGLTGSVSLENPRIRCGILAATSLTLLSIVSIRPLRQPNYELFLIVHLILVLIVVIGAYFHTQDLNLGYFLWPTFIIWGLDRLLRLLRIIVFNFGYFRPKPLAEFDAHVQAIAHDFLRVTIFRPKLFSWSPGQNVYISAPGVAGLPFEAHPFTISTIPNRNEGQEYLSQKIVLLIKVRDGFTKSLREAAGKDKTVRLLVDGPYSSPPHMIGFDTALLISGGSGISFTLPLLMDAIQRAKDGRPTCSRVVFIWANRDPNCGSWISDILLTALEDLPVGFTVSIQIHITSSTKKEHWDIESSEATTESEAKSEISSSPDLKLPSIPNIDIRQGRPNVESIINEEINENSGDISVNVCGSFSLVRNVRKALCRPRFMEILKGGPNVNLHVEAYGTS